ncbi:hypothetical protein CRE_05197 [Caenorhabditis remanei]|uniref:Glycosyltransferase family 92 protein n=1 Tax=Caenorhabditis remanei TaxID=31234 RepID=E3NE80_CAERE|nr:hypothetical protein CRE_05197 [Caenorhabditis remanei]
MPYEFIISKKVVIIGCLISTTCLLYFLFVNSLQHLNEYSPVRVEHYKRNYDEFIIADPRGSSKVKLNVSHAFITSIYYYPTSKSFGSNAVAFNMAIDQRSNQMRNHTFNVIGTNSSTSLFSTATSQAEGVGNCRYTTLMGRINTVENLEKLEIESNGVTVEVPFKMARYSAPKPVIICISPQFVAEQWQIFMMHVNAANRFGGHLHVYLTSIIESYFELMKVYEREGYLTLDYWLRMKLTSTESPYFDPNSNIEWRNQHEQRQIHSSIWMISYSLKLSDLSGGFMQFLLLSGNKLHFRGPVQASAHHSVKREKCCETRSRTIPRGFIIVNIPTLVHVQLPVEKNGKRKNKSRDMWKISFGKLKETIREDDIKAIEEDIYRIRNLSSTITLASNLPSSDFYLPIVFKCYYDAFYGPAFDHKPGGFGCPNADFCQLPQREDYKCIHSDAKYYSGPHMKPVTYHFTTDSFWSKNIGCYQ